MAARRLLIVMLVLLGISTLAAALVPPQGFRDDTSSSTTTTTETAAPAGAGATGAGAPGQEVAARIFVGGKTVPVVPLALGDQLALTVCSDDVTDLLEIPKLLRVDPISPGLPVHFNLLPDVEGSYAIRFVEADRVAARIEVGPTKSGARGEPAAAPKTGCPAPARR